MKFQLLLLGLAFIMKRASRKNPDFQKKLEGKEIEFEISSDDGVCRHYRVKDGKVQSKRGSLPKVDFAIRFISAEAGLKTMSSKKMQHDFMVGIQDRSIRIEGKPAEVLWFQSIAGIAMGNKKTKKKKKAA